MSGVGMLGAKEALIGVAGTLAIQGHHAEAEALLHAGLERTPDEHAYRSAMMVLRSTPKDPVAITLPLLARWARAGWMREAQIVFSTGVLGAEATPWLHALGELLAPLPMDAAESLQGAHWRLIHGDPAAAMVALEESARLAPLPTWAAERLAKLRWILLDHAEAVPAAQRTAPRSLLAEALRPAVESRSIEGMWRIAEGMPDAADVAQALGRLVSEATMQVLPESTGGRTMPLRGRSAASMQLMMANFEEAAHQYTMLVQEAPSDGALRSLLEDVRLVHDALQGRAPMRSASPASFEDVTAGGRDAGFGDVTRVQVSAQGGQAFSDEVTRVGAEEELHALSHNTEAMPVAPGRDTAQGHSDPKKPSAWSFDDPTRVAQEKELPLSAFGDEETRSHQPAQMVAGEGVTPGTFEGPRPGEVEGSVAEEDFSLPAALQDPPEGWVASVGAPVAPVLTGTGTSLRRTAPGHSVTRAVFAARQSFPVAVSEEDASAQSVAGAVGSAPTRPSAGGSAVSVMPIIRVE